MRPYFRCLQGMWTTITKSYGTYLCNFKKIKKGDWIWREVQKQVKLKVEGFKTM